MGTLYDNISHLCDERRIKPGKVCNDLGLSRGLMTDLKMGRKKGVSAETANRIANYFGVSVDYLLTGEEKTPAESGERAISYDDFTYAMQNEAAELTEDDKALLLSMARQLNTARKKKESE